ncbi:MAG: PEP-CTERM sorting domain-containing protein [Sideroxyarcus sp.]|nr:PEP-CTERM sorting domain-containing protein [Sideroxyarcus sp.]
MLKRFKTLFNAGLVCVGSVAVVGLAQAAPTQLDVVSNVQGNTSWQDIAGASYTFNDANNNGQVNVGETVTFTIDMHKTYWGVHDFDALKFWINDSNGTNLFTSQSTQGIWDFDAYTDNSNHQLFDYGEWTGGDQFFTFNYTFATTGVFGLTASVMCSESLSDLSSGGFAADWNAWSQNTHQIYHYPTNWIQGETETYQLNVVQQPVPEPETYAMLMLGLGLMGAVARRRKA